MNLAIKERCADAKEKGQWTTGFKAENDEKKAREASIGSSLFYTSIFFLEWTICDILHSVATEDGDEE